MSDEKNKSGKVKVMYVRSGDDNEKRGQNPRTGKGGGKAPARGDKRRPAREDHRGGREPRRETSPWRTVSRAPGSESTPTPDHGGISGKSVIDPEVLRRQRAEETRVYGENACQALFSHRPESIVRAWFVQSVTPRFKEALRWMAANRKAYHVVDDAELVKASGTEHHGGVCFLIKKRAGTTVAQWLETPREQDCVLALEDIGNPHNLGGIMRTCAHFNVQGLLVQDPALLESGAAVRGAEFVKAISDGSFPQALQRFRTAGYSIVTTSSHQGAPLFQTALPKKMVLVLGQEQDGISDTTFADADLRIRIDGSENVESLNVSVATGILLGEWWRQNCQ